MISLKSLPAQWPQSLKQEFCTPIVFPTGADASNVANLTLHRMAEEIRKVNLLSDYYGFANHDADTRYLLLVCWLCRDLFKGFEFEITSRNDSERAQRSLADAVFVYRLEAIKRRDHIGIDRATVQIKIEQPARYTAAARSLRSRYFEAKRRADVRSAADGLRCVAEKMPPSLFEPFLETLCRLP
jgi:hypothetical protein